MSSGMPANPYRVIRRRIRYTDGSRGYQWDVINKAARLHCIWLSEEEARADAARLWRNTSVRQAERLRRGVLP